MIRCKADRQKVTEPEMHLAELNISELLAPLESPQLRDFVANVDRLNALAERSDGFVWRLKDDPRNPVPVVSPWPDNILYTLSVWESPAQLEHFVWNTVHKKIYQRKQEWFELMKSHHFVMWWVEEGSWPDLKEAAARLAHLDAHGDTDHAFGWSHLPHVKLWQSQRCG